MPNGIETSYATQALQSEIETFSKRFIGREDEIGFNYPPRIIDIHLGYKGQPCQNRCIWCYDSKSGKNKHTPRYGEVQVASLTDEIDRAIDWQVEGFRIEEVHLAGGGEPTMFPIVAQLIMDRFIEAGRDVRLTTNGISIPDKLLPTIKKAHKLSVSLNGCDRQSYQQAARFDGFENVMATLDMVLKARREEKFPLEVIVTYVFSEGNLDGLESLILRLNDMGVDKFGARYDLFSSPEDTHNIRGKEILEGLVSMYSGMNIKVGLKSPPVETLPEKYSCFAPFVWPAWNPLHGVFPCAHVTDKKNRIKSNIYNGIYSLVEITDDPEQVREPKCHRRCPSRNGWYNLYLNGHELAIFQSTHPLTPHE